MQKALAEGRIRKACKVHDRCPDGCEVLGQGIDPAIADVDWMESSHQSNAAVESVAQAQLIKTMHQARLLRLRLERERGNLLNRAEVESERIAAGQAVQKQWFLFCKRVAARCANLTDPRAIQEYLEDEARRSLSRAGVAVTRAR